MSLGVIELLPLPLTSLFNPCCQCSNLDNLQLCPLYDLHDPCGVTASMLLLASPSHMSVPLTLTQLTVYLTPTILLLHSTHTHIQLYNDSMTIFSCSVQCVSRVPNQTAWFAWSSELETISSSACEPSIND